MSGGSAQRRVEIARRLPELPVTEAAFRDGAIGVEHTAVIARLASDVGTEATRGVEQTLVDAAHRLDPARLGWVAQHARHAIDPDGARRDVNGMHDRRRLHLSQTLDGVFVLDGLLDAEGGALLRTAIDALDRPLPAEERTAAQRRADALIELVRRQLQSGAVPDVTGQRPHLTVTTTDETLRGDAGSPAAEARRAGPLVRDAARRIACDAALTRMTLDAAGTPLDAGRTSRTVPAALRRALVARDGGCRFATCDRPPEWTDAHHAQRVGRMVAKPRCPIRSCSVGSTIDSSTRGAGPCDWTRMRG
jgi:hypothetical protein